jgi:protein CpxP
MKTVFSISAVCAVLAFSSISSANKPGYDAEFDSSKFHQRNKHMMKRMIKTLSLSEQQQVEIKAIKEQAKEKGKIPRDLMKKFKESERLLLQAEVFDEKAFITLYQTHQQNSLDIALMRAKTKNAIFNVLTIEQQEKWQEKMNKRKERFNKNLAL